MYSISQFNNEPYKYSPIHYIIILMIGSRNLRQNHYVDNSLFTMLINTFYAAIWNEIKTFLFLYSEQPKARYLRQLLYKT